MGALAVSGAVVLALWAGPPAVAGIAVLAVAWLVSAAGRPGVRGRGAGAVFLVGVCLLVAWRQPEGPSTAGTLTSGWGSYEAVVESGVESGGDGQRFEVRIVGHWDSAGRAVPVRSVNVMVTAPRLPIVRGGDRVRLRGDMTVRRDLASASFASYLGSRQIAGILRAHWRSERQPPLIVLAEGSDWSRAADEARLAMVAVLRSGSPGESGALLAGLVTGDDAGLSAERRDAFRRAGLSHITAISGSNVALLVAILLGRRGFSRRRRHWAFLSVAVLLIWTYAVVVRLDPPVVRAAIVATAGAVALRLGRRPDGMTLTGLAAAGTVVLVPAWLVSLSFLLSFAAAIVLILSADEGEDRGFGQTIVSTLRAVVAVNLATIPILLSSDLGISVTGVLANLVLGPLAAAAFALGFVAACAGLVVPALGEAMAIPAGWFAHAVIAGADVFGDRRFAYSVWRQSDVTIWVAFCLVLGTVWLSGWEGRSVRIAVRHVPRPGRDRVS